MGSAKSLITRLLLGPINDPDPKVMPRRSTNVRSM